MLQVLKIHPTKTTDCFIGEVGLLGEVRRVSRIEQRVKEAEKLGFKQIYVPKNNLGSWESTIKAEVIGVSTINEALTACVRIKSDNLYKFLEIIFH